jgi:stearoyl-CoA desaturase (Delta-9 desaturase)
MNAHVKQLDPITSRKPGPIIWSNTLFMLGTPIACVFLLPFHWVFVGLQWPLVWGTIALWALTGVGVTAGYHRLFAHRSYKASGWLRLGFAILGAGSWQNSAITWASNHRYHHRYVDTDKDPYDATRGLWFSHIGWILREATYDDGFQNVQDLWKDPVCRFQHANYWVLNLGFNTLIPISFGLFIGDVAGSLLYLGLLRIVLVHHFTFTINSLAHVWGSQPWSHNNTSRDNWILSLVSFGEGYHNYHHAFQTDYRNGPKWYNYDPSKWLIFALSLCGATTHLRRTEDGLIYRRRLNEGKERYAEHLTLVKGRHDLPLGKPNFPLKSDAHPTLRPLELQLERRLGELKSARRDWAALRAEAPSQRKEAQRTRNHKSVAARSALHAWERKLDEVLIRMGSPDPNPR